MDTKKKSSIAKEQQHSAPSGFVTGQSQHEVSWCFIKCKTTGRYKVSTFI